MRLKWKMTAEEAMALAGLDGGVCEDAVYERLIAKGLASPEDGLVRASVAGETALDAMRNAVLDPSLPVEVELAEEPWQEPARKIEDFF